MRSRVSACTVRSGSDHTTYAARANEWTRELMTCGVELFRDGASVDRGQAANVLAVDPHNPPLAAGEIVTTGSLTRAPPIAPGEVWTTKLTGIPLEGAGLALTKG
jgi:2-oxo-3-hexenedioate decarboxylase